MTQSQPADRIDVVELGLRGRWFADPDAGRLRLGVAGGVDTDQFAEARFAAGGALAIPLTAPTLFTDAGQRIVVELEATAAAGRPRGVTDALRAGAMARLSYGLFLVQNGDALLAEFGGFIAARADSGGDRAVLAGIELSYVPDWF